MILALISTHTQKKICMCVCVSCSMCHVLVTYFGLMIFSHMISHMNIDVFEALHYIYIYTLWSYIYKLINKIKGPAVYLLLSSLSLSQI